MAFPQGIYFKGVDNQVDPPNYDCENGSNNYPRTSAQGNTVGWEGAVNYGGAVTSDVRFTGCAYFYRGFTRDYRIDLPATGTYLIGCAFGDPNYPTPTRCRMVDTSTVLYDMNPATSAPAGKYYDMAGTLHASQASWTASNAAVTLTFSTTICRFRAGETTGTDGDNTAFINLLVTAGEGGGGGGTPLIYTRSLLGVGY